MCCREEMSERDSMGDVCTPVECIECVCASVLTLNGHLCTVQETQDVCLGVQECLSLLASAYVGAVGLAVTALEALVLEHVESVRQRGLEGGWMGGWGGRGLNGRRGVGWI